MSTDTPTRPDLRRTSPFASDELAASALFHDVDGARTFVRLADGDVWSCSPDGSAPLRITAVTGDLWITQSGSADDVAVEPGQSFVARGGGKVVVEALGDATFRVEVC